MFFLKTRIAVILLWSFFMVVCPVMPAAIIDLNFVSHPSSANTALDSWLGELNGAPLGAGVVAIPPNPVWGNLGMGASWISLAQTGNPASPGYVTFPNGTVMGLQQALVLPVGTILSATLKLFADDTANIWVNGTLVAAASNVVLPNCNGVPGCVPSTLFTGDVASLLHTGANTLYIEALQLNGSSTGIQSLLTVSMNIDTGVVPEPASLAMIGLGLVGLGLLRRRQS